MVVADGSGGTDFHCAPEQMGGNVGTVRLVAQIFGKKLFAPVRRFEARLDGYVRNGKYLHYYN